MWMLSIPLVFFQLFPIIPVATSLDVPAYTPVDLILLNCGSAARANDYSGRTWNGDQNSTYLRSNTMNTYLTTPIENHESWPGPVPYNTARISYSQLSYSFPVAHPGTKFLRLYFYLNTSHGADSSLYNNLFSVTANGYTLLSNFNASLYSLTLDLPETSFGKEFIIVVQESGVINLTFTPNLNSFAFISGIEIVSLPDDLYVRNTLTQFYDMSDLTASPALETLYRLNVGGDYVQIQDDTGMFRDWSNDANYIFGADYGYTPHDENYTIKYTNKTPAYSAPEIVYRTSRTTANTSKSMELVLPVDSGFFYLLRFHFCEFLQEISNPNDRVFTININEQTTEEQADVIRWSGGSGIPIFKDYTTYIPDDAGHGKKDIHLSLLPNSEESPKYLSAMLNGLEVFKISDSKQSLAATSPGFNPNSLSLGINKNGASHVIIIVIGTVMGFLSVILMASLLFFRRPISRKLSRVPLLRELRSQKQKTGSGMSLFSDSCKHFSLKDIKAATGDFDDNFVIGQGGFGKVYKGFIYDGTTTIAAKRLHTSSGQGAQEFQTEIELLSRLRHLHLVSLIGYCEEHSEMILVYDYMAHGTLRDHLYNSNNPPLAWKHRLKICLGAAKGLDYLHTGTKHAIIHRDVKSTNILLDENWVAKVSDFGLSKIGPSDTSNTHVSTVVKGSFGYMDPEYYKLQQLTEKSDVYSFGVVLFEVLCGRPAILPRSPEPDDQVNLAEWAKLCFQEGKIHEIVDLNLEGQIAPECLDKFVETAIQCLTNNRANRPSMSEVVRSLELAIQLQCGNDAAAGSSDPQDTAIELTETRTGLQSADVFSELVNPSGR